MAVKTGSNLLLSIIESTGAEVNNLIRLTLSAKLQQMIDSGTYSKLAAGIAMSGFSTSINDRTGIKELGDAIEKNAALIEAAAEDEVDQIVFPNVGNGGDDPHETTTISADIGTIEDGIYLDAAQGSFLFTDDASVATFVVISNFTADDKIQIKNLPVGATYQFTSDGNDVDITYNYNDAGLMNHIKLIGVGNEIDSYYDEAGFEDAMGFDAVTYA
jgi:hypothetical protein